MTGLRFEDVNTPAQVPGLTFDHEYICRLNDSTEYRLKLAKKGEKTYLQCEADYLDKTPVTIKPNQKDSPDELKKKEAKLLAQENVQKFTLRHKGWIYEVADWKAKYLTKKQSDLLEDKEKPAEKKAEAPAPAAGCDTERSTPAVTPDGRAELSRKWFRQPAPVAAGHAGSPSRISRPKVRRSSPT